MQLDQAQVAKYRDRTQRSNELWLRTKEIIPTGHGGGMGYFLPHPIMVESGRGCWLWDVDGNRYLDLRLGDWVLIHGHGDADIERAAIDQLSRSVQIGGPEWDLGHRMATQLVTRTPSIDKVRFFASGTDANLCALRLARVFTGRNKIAKAKGSYHGAADELLVGSSILRDPDDLEPAGVSPSAIGALVEIPFNDPDGAEAVLTQHAAEIAAVFIEPVMTAMGMVEAKPEFLRRVREVTQALSIVLVFDEVVTYPVAYGGGQVHFGVTPDLTTMGKAIGGGLPASAVGGSEEIMNLLEPDAHGGVAPMGVMATFGGNQLAMATGSACLAKLTPEVHDDLNARADRTRARISELGQRYRIPLHATGLGHLIGLHWAEERVVDFRTRLLDDREKVININLALDNAGYYQTFTGIFLLSTVIGDQEVDAFLYALERSLHTLGYVS